MKTPEEIMEAFKCFDAIAYIEQLEADLERANHIIMQIKAMLDDDGK